MTRRLGFGISEPHLRPMSTPASSTNESVLADPRPPSLLERLAATPLSLLERLSTPPAESPVLDMDEDTSIPSSDHLALLRSSVGALFRPSHIPANDPEKLHCAVKVHGGDEPRFHDDTPSLEPFVVLRQWRIAPVVASPLTYSIVLSRPSRS